MGQGVKIGTVVFGGGDSTHGMEVIKGVLRLKAGIECTRATAGNAREFDILLVSLYWWENIYDFVRFLLSAGIDPEKKRPILIAGGLACLNPWPIIPFCHAVVLGDGETAIVALVNAAKKRDFDSINGMPGVVTAENAGRPNKILFAGPLSPFSYVESRTNKTARIEIARGCKAKCPFCLVSFVKPYRELPKEVIRSLISVAPTRNVALFAPEKAFHSGYQYFGAYIRGFRKRDTGQDVRLDLFQKLGRIEVNHPRFGIEGFTEHVRERLGKYPRNNQLIDAIRYLLETGKTTKGNPIKAITAYMIADLPGERSQEALREFADTLRQIDTIAPHKITMFLTINSFAPYYFTPMQWEGITLDLPFNSWWKESKPFAKRIVIAQHGGLMGAARRLAQMVTIRADERCAKLIYFLATYPKARAAIKTTKPEAAELVLSAIARTGYERDYFMRPIGTSEPLPWDWIESQVPKDDMLRHRWHRGAA